MWAVEREPVAEDDLAAVWVAAADKAAVTRAAGRVEAALARDPYAAAIHLSEGLWQLLVPPLAVDFEIDPSSETTTITAVGTVA